MERATSIEDHVTCSVCMDLYSDPMALPCLHSFCRRCLQGMFSATFVFNCPECRADVRLGPKGIDGLPKNFQLAGIVESYRKENEGNPKVRPGSDVRSFCSKHRMVCELQCKTCKKSICLKCLVETHSSHKLSLISTKDELLNTNSRDQTCRQHHRPLKLFCSLCEQVICLECVVNNHCEHQFASIEETYSYSQELLNGNINELDVKQRQLRATQKTCRTLAQKVQNDAQKQRQDLSMYFARLREILDKREAILKTEVDTKEQHLIQCYMTKSGEAERTEKIVMSCAESARRLGTENKITFLQHYPKKSNSINTLLADQSTDFPPQLKGFDDVTLVTCNLDKELTNIYWQWPKEELKPTRKAPPVPATRKSSIGRKLQNQSTQNSRALPVGSHVRRGKDWTDGREDGGPGHIGVITQICLDPNTYTVRWPSGRQGTYTYSPPYEEMITPA
ncbi:hypothetical protein ACF0H5_020644 [Mactra antiquata]